MTKETITRVKLTAADGMVLTDGEVYGREIYLAATADASVFCEIAESEYLRILEKIETGLDDV